CPSAHRPRAPVSSSPTHRRAGDRPRPAEFHPAACIDQRQYQAFDLSPCLPPFSLESNNCLHVAETLVTVDGSPYMNTATRTAYHGPVVGQFAIFTVVWGIVGMGLGVCIAAQLACPGLDVELPWASFGRVRPLHPNAVIFVFGGCALFATSYYAVQRTGQT